jgi:polysaccharide deacetylase 2 family uncharacterized protein YibQ
MQSMLFLAGELSGLHFLSRASAVAAEGVVPPSLPAVALIIDDIGYSRSIVKRFLKIKIPLTFSILPALKRSRESAFLINAESHDIMLHQPMEPFDTLIDPGPGALYLGDDSVAIDAAIQNNLNSVPFVIGMNNHMGSKFTSHQKAMTDTVQCVGRRHLFFIDSLTAYSSIGFQTARALNVPSLRRDIFLDNHRDVDAIYTQIGKLRHLARKKGKAIGIGHPFPETISAIESFAKGPLARDVAFVGISSLL